MKYKLTRAEDNTVWVSIQPLQSDIKDVIDKVVAIDQTKLTHQDKLEIDLKLLGLKAVFTFLDTLMTEQEQNENTNRQAAQFKH